MNYSDYGSMQQAAQRRVYEMQRRARAALGRTPPTPEPPAADEPVPTEPPPAGKDEKMPQAEPDTALLLSLIGLLIADGGDRGLIALLLYILG